MTRMIDDLIDEFTPSCMDSAGRVYVFMRHNDPQPYCTYPELDCVYMQEYDLNPKCFYYKYESMFKEMKKNE